MFLLATLAVLTGHEVVEIFTLYCGLVVALQALAIYALARNLFPQLPAWAPAVIGGRLLLDFAPTSNGYDRFVVYSLFREHRFLSTHERISAVELPITRVLTDDELRRLRPSPSPAK